MITETQLHTIWDDGWRAGVQALLSRVESDVAPALPDETVDQLHRLAEDLLDSP